jgi:mannosyltransferase
VLTTLLLVRADRSGRALDWACYAVAVALTAYVFLFTLLLLTAHLVTLLVARRPRRGWLVAAAAGTAATTPLLVVASQQTGQVAWIHLRARELLDAGVLGQFFLSPRAPASGLPLAGAVLLLLLATALAALGLRSARGNPVAFYAMAVSLPWAVLPTIIVGAYTLSGTPVYQERYLAFSAPGLCLLVGLGLLALRPRRATFVAACILLVGAAAPILVQQKAPDSKNGDDYRRLAAFAGPRGQDLQVLVLSRPGENGIRIAYPRLLAGVRDLNRAATPADSATLWGTLASARGRVPALAGGRVGLVTLTRAPRQARPWRRWLRDRGCRPGAEARAVRFTIRAYTCPRRSSTGVPAAGTTGSSPGG